MVIKADALFEALFRVAVTVKLTAPPALPAVNVVDTPVAGVKLPSLLLRDQAYVMPVVGHVALHVGVATKACELPEVTVGAAGFTVNEVSVVEEVVVTVITVDVPRVVPPSVALTKMPPVIAVLPAVKNTEPPVPLSEPSALLVRTHAYAMPDGQVALHVGAAVKAIVFPELTVGVVGLIATDSRMMKVVVTVMTVVAPRVVPLRVALTKMPTVPAVLPAVKATEAPTPPSEPSRELLKTHTYVMPEGQVVLHVGVAVKGWVPPEPTVGMIGLTATEIRTAEVVLMVMIAGRLCTVTPFSVALTKSATVPTLLPAVKVTGMPTAEPRVPIEPFVSVHEYVVPEGHVDVHVGVAVKV
jgi:hypothetical protein